jgi:hypothetical protein
MPKRTGRHHIEREGIETRRRIGGIFRGSHGRLQSVDLVRPSFGVDAPDGGRLAELRRHPEYAYANRRTPAAQSIFVTLWLACDGRCWR